MGEEIPEDQFARFRAEMDQARETLGELALTVRRYYQELVEQGFTKDQALTIVVAWQATILGSPGGE